MCTIVISICVFQEPEVVKEQLRNISYFTSQFEKVYIIYNCNDIMYKTLVNNKLECSNAEVIINPDIINKKRYTGLINAGIMSNLKYAVDNLKFDYFLMISSRTALTASINSEKIRHFMSITNNNIQHLKKTGKKFFYSTGFNDYRICDGTTQEGYKSYLDKDPSILQWFWGRDTLNSKRWFQKMLEFDFIIGGKHEGICFTYDLSNRIYDFLKRHPDLEREMRKSPHCVEEMFPLIMGNNLKINDYELTYTFLPDIMVIGRSVKLRVMKNIELKNKNFNGVNVNMIIDETNKVFENIKQQNLINNKIFIYNYKNLINTSLSRCIFNATNCDDYKNKKILMINNNVILCKKMISEFSCRLSINLRKEMGKNFIDFPKNDLIYRDSKRRPSNFKYILEHENIDRENIENRIINKEFDYIIYGLMGVERRKIGDIRRNTPYWKIVSKNYKYDNIIFLYDESISKYDNGHINHLLYHSDYGKCIIKELIDFC